ncbi:DUF1206 domain-containing protein [Subtercola frigoramans]|uniref:DUF1206 domain-containing protein n=1 Tax=Subtercola frigoramans TaxID=120298 RepID=UPI001961BA55
MDRGRIRSGASISTSYCTTRSSPCSWPRGPITRRSAANTQKATGLDGALEPLRTLHFGTIILTAIGAALIAYGLYSFVRARHGRL